MRSGLTLPDSASLHRLGVKVSRNCSVSLPTETTNGCLMSCVHVLAHWVLNCSASRSRFWNSIECPSRRRSYGLIEKLLGQRHSPPERLPAMDRHRELGAETAFERGQGQAISVIRYPKATAVNIDHGSRH